MSSGMDGPSNPRLRGTFDRAADAVEGRMRGATAFQGLSNSGVQQMHNRNLNDLATNIYGGAYETDANRRLQAGMLGANLEHQAGQNQLSRQMQTGMFGDRLNYEQRAGDLNRQMQAAQFMDTLGANTRQQDLNRQMQAALSMPGFMSGMTQYGLAMGDVERSGQQDAINAAMQQWNEALAHPYQALNTLAQGANLGLGTGGTRVSSVGPGMFTPPSTAGMLGGFGWNYG